MEVLHAGIISAVVICFVALWWQRYNSDVSMICYDDLSQDTGSQPLCKRKCTKNHFSVVPMESCLPKLTCTEMQSEDVRTSEVLGTSVTKMVYLAEWKGLKLVLNSLYDPVYGEDFRHGLRMLEGLQGSPLVTQLMGQCGDSYVTEYYPLGSAERLLDHLEEGGALYGPNSLKEMLQLCVSCAEVIHFLHTSPLGTRVMCDSNSLQKTLSQFLLREDLTLIANDLDALPEVNRSAGMLVKCGHEQIHGEFVAPEQLWPFDDRPFEDESMPGYDEKTDIWKIPSICEHFLSLSPESDAVLFHLFSVHKQCKSVNPANRPAALDVLEHYKTVLEDLYHSEM